LDTSDTNAVLFLQRAIAPFPLSDRTSELNPRSPLPFLDWAIVFWWRRASFGGEERVLVEKSDRVLFSEERAIAFYLIGAIS